jgi:type IV secretory pathway TrbD component
LCKAVISNGIVTLNGTLSILIIVMQLRVVASLGIVIWVNSILASNFVKAVIE